MRALGLALLLASSAAHAIPPELEPDEPVWSLGFGLHAQPDQHRDYACNPGLDCASPTQSFFAGSIRGGYQRPEVWSTALTLGLGHAVDFEEHPRGGFQVLTLKADVQLELGRRRGEIGAALRASEAIALGWSADGAAFGIDFPGVAVLIGTRELWGEVQIPTLPTEADPRQFYGGVGWHPEGWFLEGGIALFGSLGYQRQQIIHSGSNVGVWAAGSLPIAARWDIGANLAIGYPFVFGLSLTYHVAPSP